MTAVRFDWAPPCKVPVDDVLTGDGHRAVSRIWVEVVPHGTHELAARIGEMTLVEIDGVKAEEMDPAQVAAFAAASANPPTLIIDRSGAIVRVEGLDANLDQALAPLLAMAPPEEAARLRDVAASGAMRTQIEASARILWTGWVGAWVGLQLGPGETSEASGLEYIDAVRGEATWRLEHRGMRGENATLRRELRLEGAAYLAAFAPLRELASALAGKPAPELVGGYDREVWEVEVDPATLRPVRARRESDSRSETKDRPPKIRQTVQEQTFRWADAIGCK
jgi:hypothetical protein